MKLDIIALIERKRSHRSLPSLLQDFEKRCRETMSGLPASSPTRYLAPTKMPSPTKTIQRTPPLLQRPDSGHCAADAERGVRRPIDRGGCPRGDVRSTRSAGRGWGRLGSSLLTTHFVCAVNTGQRRGQQHSFVFVSCSCLIHSFEGEKYLIILSAFFLSYQLVKGCRAYVTCEVRV